MPQQRQLAAARLLPLAWHAAAKDATASQLHLEYICPCSRVAHTVNDLLAQGRGSLLDWIRCSQKREVAWLLIEFGVRKASEKLGANGAVAPQEAWCVSAP